MSARSGLPGAVLGAGSVVILAFRDGGYDDPPAWRAATVALLAAAALAVVLRGTFSANRLQLAMVAGLAAFAGWTALSALWSPDAHASLLEAQRAVFYLAAVVAAVAVRGPLLAGVMAGIGVVCAYSLGQRLLEGPPSPPDPFEGTLLTGPIGYANALGGIAAIGLAATVVLALDRRRRLPALVLGGLLLTTLVLTGSRGGWLGAVVGAVVGLSLALDRRRVAAVTAALAAVMLAVGLTIPAGSLADEAFDRGGERAWYWHVAWQEVAAAPVVSDGDPKIVSVSAGSEVEVRPAFRSRMRVIR